jgi:hypothetical protein
LGEDYGKKLEEMWGGVEMRREMNSWDVRYGVDIGQRNESYNFYEEFRVDLEPKKGKILWVVLILLGFFLEEDFESSKENGEEMEPKMFSFYEELGN